MNRQKILLAAALVAAVGIAAHFNLIPGQQKQAAAVPTGFALAPDDGGIKTIANTTSAIPLALPTTTVAPVHQPILRFNIWEWNAQFGLLYAVGGPQTTKGSLTDTHGVTVKLTRQDDTSKSQGEQIKFASLLAKGDPNPSEGIQFTVIMGDQAAGYIASANKDLTKLDKNGDYRAEVIGAVGFSYGEDGCWGPQAWKDDPNAMKGGTIAGVLREGDWNICQYLLANASIKNNPDASTYDPDAVNWFASDDYLKAAEDYNSNRCEDRKVVQNGKLTGAMHHTCVDALGTWTPGDVNAAKGRGGLVRLLSTKENVYQMPAAIVGIHKYDAAHAKTIQNMLSAFFEASDMVRSYPEALNRAGQISYAVYADQTPGYWVKYFKGTVERDSQHQPVPLGGSRVINLADNLFFFGLTDGSGGVGASPWKATYEGFGNIVKQQYPKLVPDFPPAEMAVNTTFLQALQQSSTPQQTDATTTLEAFNDTTEIDSASKVSAKNWSIQFMTGSANLTPTAETTLNTLYQQLAVGGALQVEIDGHTDNTGTPSANIDLSQRRADTVKGWMTNRAGKLFPEGRIITKGFGDTQPIAPNTTDLGRATNRRVTVILGTKN